MLEHILVGFIFVVIGAITLRYNYQLVGITGEIGSVERYLGYGSTYGFLKIVSILLCLGGFMYMFGLFNPAMEWLLSPLRSILRFPSSS